MPTTIAETREAFLANKAKVVRDMRRDAVDLSRSLVSRMSAGERFSPEDFFFAATLGDTDKYPDEGATFHALTGLQGHEVVAVTDGDTIRYVGQTAIVPWDLKVYAGDALSSGEQDNRDLTALVCLVRGVRRAREDRAVPARDIQVFNTENEPTAVPVLRAWSEPEFDGRAFYRPQGLLVGAQAVLMFAFEHDDELGSQQVAHFIEMTH